MKRLTNKEYLTAFEDALYNFNMDYLYLNNSIDVNSSGIGKEFEPYLLKSLIKNTNYSWYQGDKETELDFVCVDNPEISFELKTNLSGVFTGGCKGGRENQLKKNPNGSNKYSLNKNDNNKICIYDKVNYLFCSLDRPNNGFNKFYIKKIMCGQIKEIDWNNNRNLNKNILKSLEIIIDETDSIERFMRCPWTSKERKNNYSLEQIIHYLICQETDENKLNEYEVLLNKQKNIIKTQQIKTIANEISQSIPKDKINNLIQELNILSK